jgi:hypothetical protein
MPTGFAGSAAIATTPRGTGSIAQGLVNDVSDRTLNKRADILAAYTAIRNGILAEEVEFREELAKRYQTYTLDVLEYSRRLPAIRSAEEAKRQAQAERLAAKATLRIPVCLQDEEAARRDGVIEEQRDRRRLERQSACDFRYTRLTEKLQLLIRAEDRKRYSLEKNEAADFQQLAQDYAQTPWKPTIKMLGQCPFARKNACPFSNRHRMCHGMAVSDEHYSQSAVEHVGDGMM